MFYGSPGCKLWTNIGSGPIRGAHVAGGYGWVVSGTALYRISALGASTKIGAIPGSGRVSMEHNDIQLAVMHEAGWEVVTLATLGIGSVAGAPTTAQGTYQDSYIVFPLANGTYGWTDIDNAQSIDALSFASAEAQPDPIVAVLSDHRELWLFGSTTTEIAQTSGDADLVFTRTAILEYGCIAKYSPAKADETIFWLGSNEAGKDTVFRAEGYSPSRISTHALENAIAGYGDTSTAWGYCYQQNGHTFYVLTFPGYATWSFDASCQRWTQLTYRNPSTGAREQHRGNAYMFLGGKHIVGDYVSGNLYQLDLETDTDNGDPIERERAWAVIQNDGKWLRHDRLQLFAEMGVGLDGKRVPGQVLVQDESGQVVLDESGAPLLDLSDVSIADPGGDPTWLLDWSDDGCRTWSNARKLPLGRVGAFRNRALARRLGLSRNRVYRLRTSEPVKHSIYGVDLDATASGK